MPQDKQQLFSKAFKSIWELKRHLQDFFLKDLKIKNVTLLQIWALFRIDTFGPISVGKLAQHLGLSLSSTVQLIDRLKELNWVRITKDPQDNRVKQLSLSKSGQETMIDLRADIREKMAQLFGGLTEKDLQDLIRVYDKLLNRVKLE